MASLDRDYARYAVFWPAPNGMQPAISSGVKKTFNGYGSLRISVPAEGRVAHGGNAQACAAICTVYHRCMGQAATFLIRLLKGLPA